MRLKAADLFCGAGGTTAGAEATGECRVEFAVNHWSTAVATHSANFPHTRHVNSRVDLVNPGDCGKIDLLFASPECTHHSRARGGRPTSDQQRSGAWDLMKWIDYHRPSWIVVENVREFEQWGPVANGKPMASRRGAFFDAWVMAIRAAGYQVDWRAMNAADYGAATSRERLFVIARKGNRQPVFPDPKFCEKPGGELPGLSLPRWRAAAEVIDWSLPCPSIFSRKRPLADKTLARIEAGLRRFVGPFVAQWDNHGGNGSYTRPIDRPLGTFTTKANMGLCVPFQVIYRNNQHSSGIDCPIGTICTSGAHHGMAVPYMVPFFGERTGQPPRSHAVGDALPCVTSHGAGGLSVPFVLPRQGFYDSQKLKRCRSVGEPMPTITASHIPGAIVAPFMIGQQSGAAPRDTGKPVPTIATEGAISLTVPFLTGCGARDGQSPPTALNRPTNTITTKDAKCLAVPFLCHYYGTQNLSSPSDPLDTITTKERHGICLCGFDECPPQVTEPTAAMASLLATMRELGVADIGFRMLANHELAAAQGFDAGYIFRGNKGDVTRQIGNSVSPPQAQAITESILAA